MGFRHPELLWLGLLAVPLIVFYILKVRRAPLTVPSALLWREALTEVEAQVPFRRLRRDWLLLLQLLLLALLVTAAAGPHWRTRVPLGARTAVVLDASASMLAGDRIARARRQVDALVDGKQPTDELLIVRAGVRPTVLAPLTSERVVIDDALAGFAAAPARADLGAALTLARSILGEDGKLVLVTDGASPIPPVEGLTVLSVGGAEANVGIVALGVRASDPSGQQHDVFVRLRNASGAAVRGTVEVRVDGHVRDASAVRVDPDREASRTLRLVGVAEGRVEARWQSDAPDSLAADDSATWILRPPRPRTYRIASRAPQPYLRHALGSVAGWSAARPGRPADLEIVVRESPTRDGPPFLWIDPAELRRDVVEGPPVLSWDRTHPLLRFVNLHPVRLGTTPVLERPEGARVLAESAAGPLMLAGTRGERRCVIWGFDVLQTSLPLSVSFPLLVHNALEFLVPADWNVPGGTGTGVAPQVPWPDATGATLTTPSGATHELYAAGGLVRLPALEETGPYVLEDGRRSVRFAASLVDAEESDLRERFAASGAVAADAPESGAGGADRARAGFRDLWRVLAALAVVLVLLEGVGFHRRWSP